MIFIIIFHFSCFVFSFIFIDIIYDLYLKRHMDTSQSNKNKEVADS